MNSKLITAVKTYKKPLVIAVLLMLSAIGAITRFVGWLTGPLTKTNNEYLEASIKDTAHLMIPVGIAKAGADLVEGSTIHVEAGVVFAKAGMSVEAGDTLQPLLDYIDITWRLLLVSMIYLVSVKSILASAIPLAKPLLMISLVAYLLNSLLAMKLAEDHPLRQSLDRMGPLFLLCALLFSIILPLTVSGAAYLSRHTTDPLREELWQSFDKIGAVFSMEKFHESDELNYKAVILKDKIVEIGRFSKDAIGDVASSVCKLAAIKLLNGIVFPLASLIFLIWLVRGCLYPALGLSPQSLSSEDFHKLIAWAGQRRERKPSNQDLDRTSDTQGGSPAGQV